MKTLTVGDLKTNFSEVLKAVQLGEEFAIAFGKRKEVVAYLVPKQLRTKAKRKIGILEGKASVTFKDDYKMTDEEFLAPLLSKDSKMALYQSEGWQVIW